MSVLGVLVRFAILYPLSLIVVGAVIKMIGLDHLSIANVMIIFVLLMILIEKFAKKNNRYLSGKEMVGLFVGVLSIDLCFQFLFVLLLVSKPLASSAALMSLLFVVSIHGLVILVVMKTMRKNLVKRKILIKEDKVAAFAEER